MITFIVSGVLGVLLSAWVILTIVKLIFGILPKEAAARHGPTGSEGGSEATAGYESVKNGLKLLRERDPGFDRELFLRRAKACFLKLRACRDEGNYSPARPLVSDGQWECLTTVAAIDAAAGLRRGPGRIDAYDSEIWAVESDRFFDAIHVKIHFDGRSEPAGDDPLDLVHSGARLDEEVWTFVRRPGRRTLEKPGPVEGFCPNCGSPLEISTSGFCGACKSWINSGEYDWVLTRITDARQWSPPSARKADPVRGSLANTAPELNFHFLEERALLAYWRWQRALLVGNLEPLRRVAAEGFDAAAPDIRKESRFYHAKTTMDTERLVSVKLDATHDSAEIMVGWSSAWRVPHGLPRLGASCLDGRKDLLTFIRKHGAPENTSGGLCSLRCHQCGAPPPNADETACAYCGAAFNDGSVHWVLSRIQTLERRFNPELER